MALLRTARLFMHYVPPLRAGETGAPRAIVPLYACPQGVRAVLRSIQMFSEPGDGSGSINLFSDEVPAGTVIFQHNFGPLIDGSRWVGWNGQVVLNAGDRIEYSGTNAMTLTGSGAIMPIE